MSAADITWVFLLSILCFLSIQISRYYLGHWFSPLSIYICGNAGSLGLYHLRWLDLIPLSLATYGLALASMALFTLGSLLAVGWRPLRVGERAPQPYDSKGLDLFFYVTAILANVGWLLAAALVTLRFGIAGVIANLWLLQNEFQMQFIGYLNLTGILVAPTYVIKRAFGSRRPLDHVLLGLALVGLILAGIKTYITVSVIAAGLAWSVSRPRRFRGRHAALGFCGLLVFFVIYTQHIDVFVHKEYPGSEISSKVPWLQRPYLYAVGSWPALETLFQGEVAPPRRFGHVVLEPLWKILSGLGIVPAYPRPLPFTQIGADMFNVYSFVGEIYWDVGLWPALLASWLLGILATRLYYRARVGRYWGHRLVYAVFGYGVFLSLFQCAYSFNMMYLLTYTYVLGFVVMRGGVLVNRKDHN